MELSRLEGRDAGPEKAAGKDAAEALNAQYDLKLGDEVELVRLLRKPTKLKVVGVLGELPFGGLWRVFMTLETLQKITGEEGQLSQVDIVTGKGMDPEAVATGHRPELGPRLLLQTTERA